MSLCNIVNSVNKIKRLFRKYGASNVNETFLFDVSILLLLSNIQSAPFILHVFVSIFLVSTFCRTKCTRRNRERNRLRFDLTA